MYYVRKIAKGKWLQNDIANGQPISADACTNCLRTSKNTLSLWAVEEIEDVEDGVLAQVAAFDRLDAIDIVVLEEEELLRADLQIVATEGRTPVVDLVGFHRDVVNLTYESLGRVAQIVAAHVVADRALRYTMGDLKRIVKKAVEAGRVSVESLEDGVRRHC